MLIEEGGVKHYCLVKSINRLLSSQTTNGKRKQHFCLRCLNPFWCEKSLNKHQEYCGNYEAVKIQMSKKGTMLVVYNCGLWDSHFCPFLLIFTSFFLKFKIQDHFFKSLKHLKKHRYIIQLLLHHMIYSTNSSKSSQLNSISLKSSALYLTYIFKSFQLNSIS